MIARLVAGNLGLELHIAKLQERTAGRQAAPFRRREALKVAE